MGWHIAIDLYELKTTVLNTWHTHHRLKNALVRTRAAFRSTKPAVRASAHISAKLKKLSKLATRLLHRLHCVKFSQS